MHWECAVRPADRVVPRVVTDPTGWKACLLEGKREGPKWTTPLVEPSGVMSAIQGVRSAVPPAVSRGLSSMRGGIRHRRLTSAFAVQSFTASATGRPR